MTVIVFIVVAGDAASVSSFAIIVNSFVLAIVSTSTAVASDSAAVGFAAFEVAGNSDVVATGAANVTSIFGVAFVGELLGISIAIIVACVFGGGIITVSVVFPRYIIVVSRTDNAATGDFVDGYNITVFAVVIGTVVTRDVNATLALVVTVDGNVFVISINPVDA